MSEHKMIGLDVLLKDWAWLLDPARHKLMAVSPFGDILLQDETGAISLLDVNLGVLEPATISGTDPVELFPMMFDGRIAAGYEKAGLHLTASKCYGYKKQLVAGGSMQPENVYIASTIEYVSFLGDFHNQIKDLPNGTTVTIKVTNLKVLQ